MPMTNEGEKVLVAEALKSLADKAEALLENPTLKFSSIDPEDSPHGNPDFERQSEELQAAIAWARKVLAGG